MCRLLYFLYRVTATENMNVVSRMPEPKCNLICTPTDRGVFSGGKRADVGMEFCISIPTAAAAYYFFLPFLFPSAPLKT